MSFGTTASAWRGSQAAHCHGGSGTGQQCPSCVGDGTGLLARMAGATWSTVLPILLVLLVVVLVGISNRVPNWTERAVWAVSHGNAEDRLLLAVTDGHVGRVRDLLDEGISPNLSSDRGITLLMCAAQIRDTAVMEQLLISGADPNLRDRAGFSALTRAVRSGNRRAVRILLEHGADPYLPGNLGNTPIDVAEEYQQTEIREIMLAGSEASGSLHPR